MKMGLDLYLAQFHTKFLDVKLWNLKQAKTWIYAHYVKREQMRV